MTFDLDPANAKRSLLELDLYTDEDLLHRLQACGCAASLDYFEDVPHPSSPRAWKKEPPKCWVRYGVDSHTGGWGYSIEEAKAMDVQCESFRQIQRDSKVTYFRFTLRMFGAGEEIPDLWL